VVQEDIGVAGNGEPGADGGGGLGHTEQRGAEGEAEDVGGEGDARPTIEGPRAVGRIQPGGEV
jgi:hypothetical protein